VSSDETTPDPQHSVPRVSFGSDEPDEPDESDEAAEPANEGLQSDAERELQEENAETSLDQPSQ
jgi:hypothetical protein